MTILFSVNSTNYTANTRIVGPTPKLLSTYSVAKLSLTRESWPIANPLVTFAFEHSLDGSTWAEFARATASGGNIPSPAGGFLPASSITVSLPNVGNPDRRIRAVITNTATFRTAVTLEVE